MLGLQPEKRLTAKEYRERLEAADHFPRSFDILTQLVETITVGDTSVITPDARIAVMAAQYGTVLWETMGVRDPVGTRYFSKWTGSARIMDTHNKPNDTDRNSNNPESAIGKETSAKNEETTPSLSDEKKQDHTDELLVQVESLLKDLDSLDLNAVAEQSKPVVVPQKDGTVRRRVDREIGKGRAASSR
jgi:hypothetical protein